MLQTSVATLVSRWVKDMIEKGEYTTGSKLPSESELAEKMGVGRSSIREGLRILEEQNLIWKKHGVGSFVAWTPDKVSSGLERLESVTESIRRAGFEARDELAGIRLERASDEVASALDLPEGTSVHVVDTIRYAGEQPVIFCRDYLPEAYGTREEIRDGRDAMESMLDFLESLGHVPNTMRASITCLSAAGAAMEYLQVSERFPLLVLKGIIYDRKGVPLDYSENYFNTDKYEFTFNRRRRYQRT